MTVLHATLSKVEFSLSHCHIKATTGKSSMQQYSNKDPTKMEYKKLYFNSDCW